MIADFIKRWGMVTLVVSAFPAFYVFTSQFETVSAAEQKWAAHNQALVCKTVADLRREIRALEVEAKHNPNMRDFLLAQIEQIRQEIARIDPNGVC